VKIILHRHCLISRVSHAAEANQRSERHVISARMRFVDAVIDTAYRIYNSFNNLQSSRPSLERASPELQEIVQHASSRSPGVRR
jgi:hypothetical protein